MGDSLCVEAAAQRTKQYVKRTNGLAVSRAILQATNFVVWIETTQRPIINMFRSSHSQGGELLAFLARNRRGVHPSRPKCVHPVKKFRLHQLFVMKPSSKIACPPSPPSGVETVYGGRTYVPEPASLLARAGPMSKVAFVLARVIGCTAATWTRDTLVPIALAVVHGGNIEHL